VVVGKIINTIPHPDSDHLTIVDVMLGDALGQTTIVCGAPNVLSARFVPVAIE
jgi:phenylalanyl-tRNA synthetase beta chain